AGPAGPRAGNRLPGRADRGSPDPPAVRGHGAPVPGVRCPLGPGTRGPGPRLAAPGPRQHNGGAMAGHSKWATTKHKKAVVDARRGKLFARLIKNIEVAARIGGGDPAGNPTLYDAVQKARKA